VSACHSQNIGEVFLNAGIPIVIAVNAPFKILDEAARAFSKTFHSALISGKTYLESYTHAVSFVAAHK